MSEALFATTGFVTVDGMKVFYGITGTKEEGGRRPILVLHGGPGLPHQYLEPLARLANGRRVIFYDQIGCGRSDDPGVEYPWSVARLVDQVAATRKALDLADPVHLYGQSFGGFLALEHVLAGNEVASLILANTAASMPLASQHVARLRGDDASTAGEQRFMARHFIGGDGVTPEPLQRAFGAFGAACYSAIWGAGTVPSGPLKDWDASDRLAEIDVPTLIFNGRDDQLAPECGELIASGIRGSRMHVFERSAHLPFFTEPEEHDRLVEGFIDEVDGCPKL